MSDKFINDEIVVDSEYKFQMDTTDDEILQDFKAGMAQLKATQDDSKGIEADNSKSEVTKGDSATDSDESASNASEHGADSKSEANSSTEESTDSTSTLNSADLLARLELLEKELALGKLETEGLKAKHDKWRDLAQRREGELNYIRKRGQAKAPDDHIFEDETNVPHVVDDPRISYLTEELKNRAFQDELVAFASKHKDIDEYEGKMAELIKEGVSDYQAELNSGDIRQVRKATQLLLKESYIAAKEHKLRMEVEEAKTKKLQRAEEIKKKKLSGASSGSTASTTQGKKTPSTKTVDDLSDDELHAMIMQRFKAGV